jgi:hypothetical protein
MEARVAKYTDVNQIVKVCQRLHAVSSWKELDFNPRHVKRNLLRMFKDDTSTVLIAVDDGQITGVLLATIDQFFISKMLYATDVHFMCEAGGIQLLARFKRWARKNGASKIIMGLANDDPSGRVHQFYEAVGMRRVGDAYVMDLKDLQEMAA